MKKNKTSTFQPISPAAIASGLALVANVSKAVGVASTLDESSRQHLPRVRQGSADIVTSVAAMATKYGVSVPLMSVDDDLSKMEHASRLGELISAIKVLQKSLQDEVLQSKGDAWKTTTATYAMLRRASVAQPNLATELDAVTASFRKPFLAKKSREAKAQTVASETTSAKAPAASAPIAAATTTTPTT